MSIRPCTRIEPREDGHLYLPDADCYGKDRDGMWYFRLKGYHSGTFQGTHEVAEHDDGTITVSPSIVGNGFHGYLERGIWRDC